MSKRKKSTTQILSRAEKISVRRRLTFVALTTVVFAAVLVSVSNYIFLARTPEKAVHNYLGSLQRGNYFAALDRSAYGDNSAIFLKDSVYRAAQGRVENYEILSVDEHGDTATVRVRVVVRDGTQEIDLPLVKNHRSGLYNDTWQLDKSLQVNETLTTAIAFDRIMVNGKTLKLKASRGQMGDSGYTWNIPLLPGEYIFSLPDDSYYTIVGGEQSVEVGLLQTEIEPLDLTVRPSQRMWTETNSAVESWLSKCESSNSLAPPNCPASAVYDSSGHLRNPSPREGAGQSPSGTAMAEQVNITDVEWNVVSRPSLWLQQSEESAETWVADRYKPAIFNLSYRVNGEERNETVQAYIDAQVVSSGSSAAISVGPGTASTPVEN